MISSEGEMILMAVEMIPLAVEMIPLAGAMNPSVWLSACPALASAREAHDQSRSALPPLAAAFVAWAEDW